LRLFRQRVGEALKVGLVRVRLAGNCQRLALVSAGLHLKSPTGAGWPCPWQAVSAAKIDGFGFGSGVGGPAWDGRRAASGFRAEVRLREFKFWLEPKGELVVEFSQVFENQKVFIPRPTQRAGGQGRAAPPFQGFSAKSGFACWVFSAKSALAAIPFGDLRQPLAVPCIMRPKTES